jgi:hypothetical protein
MASLWFGPINSVAVWIREVNHRPTCKISLIGRPNQNTRTHPVEIVSMATGSIWHDRMLTCGWPGAGEWLHGADVVVQSGGDCGDA